MNPPDITGAFLCAVVAVFLFAGQSGQRSNAIPGDIPDDVRKGIEALGSKDVFLRMEAARKLGKMGARAAAAVPFLISMLGDTASIHFDGMINGRMSGGSISCGDEACDALIQIGEPSVEPLVNALGTHPNSLVRCAAAKALGDLSDPRSVEPLIRALADKEGSVIDSAAEALGRLKVAGVSDILFNRLNDRTASVAEGALAALARQKDARALPILAERQKSIDAGTRVRAVSLLGHLMSPESFTLVAGSVRDLDPKVRKAAADALGEIGDRRAVTGLVELLNDADSGVRYSAVVALGILKDPAALEPVKALIGREKVVNVREAAQAALFQIAKQRKPSDD